MEYRIQRRPSNTFFIYLAINFLTLIHCSSISHTNLAINGELPPSQNTTKCGDALEAQRGFISYKPDQMYENNERCVWVIRTHKVATLVQMRTQGFQDEDAIRIYELNSSGGLSLVDTITKDYDWSELPKYHGPVIYMTFTTNQYGQGTGFTMEYIGFAYKESTGLAYGMNLLEGNEGTVKYPQVPSSFARNENRAYVLVPTSSSTVSMSISELHLGQMSTGCFHNFFSVHQLFEYGFEMRFKNCERDTEHIAEISSSSPLLISFFGIVSPQRPGFSFNWTRQLPSQVVVES